MQDPLSLRFETAFRDERGIEHKSAERYYWCVCCVQSRKRIRELVCRKPSERLALMSFGKFYTDAGCFACRYKMAEHFGDAETMAKILDAPTTIKAEEAMKEIKDFNEAKWNEACICHCWQLRYADLACRTLAAADRWQFS